MKPVKPYIIYILALILLFSIIVLSYNMIKVEVKKPIVTTESFRETLWDKWGISIVIVAFVILTSGISILVLLGGDWRWE